MDRRRLVEGLKYDLEQFQLEAALPLRALLELAELPDPSVKQHLTELGQKHFIEFAERIGRRDVACIRSLAALTEVKFLYDQARRLREAIDFEAQEHADLTIHPIATTRSLRGVARTLDPIVLAKVVVVELQDFDNEVASYVTTLTQDSSEIQLLDQSERIAGATERLMSNLKRIYDCYAMSARLHKHVSITK